MTSIDRPRPATALAIVVLTLSGACRQPERTVQTEAVESSFRWTKASGAWVVGDSSIVIDGKGYDDLLAADRFVPPTSPWSFEVSLEGKRAGVFFSLDETGSKRTSHMVRFDDRTILAGFFNGGGEYTATNTFASPADPATGCVLRIDVDPNARIYRVVVNGTPLGDAPLRFRSGYIGLQSSDGRSSFGSVRLINAPRATWTDAAPDGAMYPFGHLRALEFHGVQACVLNSRSGLWYTLDDEGRILSSHGIREPNEPLPKPSGRDTSYRIEGASVIIRDGAGSVIKTVKDRFGAPSSMLALSDRFYVTDAKVGGVLEFTPDGEFVRTHDGTEIGGFVAPAGLARRDDGAVGVADYDRIVILRNDAGPVTTVSPGQNNGSYIIRMGSAKPVTGLELIGTTQILSIEQGSDGSMTVLNVPPLTTVRYKVGRAMETIPPSAGMSRTFAFTSPPADPLTRPYRRLQLLYLVYRTISYRDRYPADRFPSVPDGRTLSDDEVASLREAAAFNREFFFRNSGGRLLLNFDVDVVEDTLWLSDVGMSDPYWLEPNARVTADIERAALRMGRSSVEAYDGVLCAYAWVNHPPRRTSALRDPSTDPSDTVRIRQAFGGGTYGVPAPWKYGETAGYTGNPFQDRFSRQDWLITHEFHHQLDALMHASGMPEYAHSDLPWKMEGRFGEDFDFNAAIIRRARADEWLALSYGRLDAFRDADADGVPDDDPSLPFDEKRLGSNPSSPDSDGDGVSDLDELMLGTHRGTSPTKADSDGDGLSDALDPLPLYAVPSTLAPFDLTTRMARPTFSGMLGGVQTELSIGWTEDSLYVDVRTATPSNILFQLDAHADGWFHGFDNVQLRVMNQRDTTFVADYYLRDCASWVESPRDRKDILRSDELRFTSQRIRVAAVPSASRDIIRFSIPARPEYGLEWKHGKRFAFRFAIQHQTDLWVWDELFDRNEMVVVTLKD